MTVTRATDVMQSRVVAFEHAFAGEEAQVLPNIKVESQINDAVYSLLTHSTSRPTTSQRLAWTRGKQMAFVELLTNHIATGSGVAGYGFGGADDVQVDPGI